MPLFVRHDEGDEGWFVGLDGSASGELQKLRNSLVTL